MTRNENVSLVIADFSDLSQIRRLAAGVKAKYPRFACAGEQRRVIQRGTIRL